MALIRYRGHLGLIGAPSAANPPLAKSGLKVGSQPNGNVYGPLGRADPIGSSALFLRSNEREDTPP